MDYMKIYNSIIKKYQESEPVGYSEIHHIIPKCMGGNNKKNNLVKLPYRYHFVAHLCLAKIYGEQLISAAWLMSQCGEHNSRKYEWVRKQVAEFIRKLNTGRKQTLEAKQKQILAQTGAKNQFYGKIHTEESRKKISDSHKTRIYKKRSEETKIKMSLASKGKKKSEEHKLNLSLSKKGASSPMQGKKHTLESIAKMSESKKGNIPWNKGMKKEAI